MSKRAVYFSALLLFLTGLWACWCDVAMLWDGAYQFCSSINAGHAFLYLSRFHSWVVWQPLIWLSHVTDNVRLLKLVYAAPYCFAPLANVLLSWWLVRRDAPHLVFWSIAGAAIGALPGQIFMINDSIFQVHFFWPVWLGLLLPLTRTQAGVVALLSLFQLSHPIGIALSLFAAASALLVRQWRPLQNQVALLPWGLWFALLAVLGILKLFVWPDLYAAQEASLQRVWSAFRWGVLWWPFFALVGAWLAAWLLAWARLRPASWLARRLPTLPLMLVALVALCLIYWGLQPYLWQTAANYRRWLVPMMAPFFLGALWERWNLPAKAVTPHPTQPGRDYTGLAFAAIFTVVLGVQSAYWSRLWERLALEVSESYGLWVQPLDLDWIRQTPMEHWGLASQVILAQGHAPRVLLWSEESDRGLHERPARIHFSSFNSFAPANDPHQWFDWSVILQKGRERAPLEAP